MDPEQITDAGSAPAASQPAASGDAGSNYAVDPENGDIVWHGGAGWQPGDDPSPEPAPEVSAATPATEPAATASQAPAPAQTQTGWQQPPQEQMPEQFDPALLDDRNVQLYEQQIKFAFQQEMQKAAAITDPAARQHFVDSVNMNWQTARTALHMKKEYAKLVAASYQLYQHNQQIDQQLQPLRLANEAKKLAAQYNIKDHTKLLKHPNTGQPITDTKVMEAIAGLIGEQERQGRLSQRQGVDRPYSPAGGRGGGRSIRNMDPHSKEFEELERLVASGKHVRLVS